jgi:aryl-alcohol dehydrogenase-like predicted oxidoreductase
LGTVQFGTNYGVANNTGKIPEKEVKKILETAKELGINTIDTAVVYGDSEERLGMSGVKGFDIVTKIPNIPEGNKKEEWIEKEIIKSIKRLKIDVLYGVLLHDPKNILRDRSDTIINIFENCIKKGIIKKYGISIYDPAEIEYLHENYKNIIIQAPFNLVDRRIKNSGYIDLLKENGCEIHARSIFLQGLLLMNKKNIPEKFKKWESLWKKWDVYLNEKQKNPVYLSIGFVRKYDFINKIIIGVDNSKQFTEIISEYEKSKKEIEYPDLECDDELLINPYNWGNL